MHISHPAGARVCENSNDKNVKVCARGVPFCWVPIVQTTALPTVRYEFTGAIT